MKLTIELVPATAWGNNLRERLGSTAWRKLSAKVRADAGHKCQICGNADLALHCHEVWSYDDEHHVQKLVSLQSLCYQCHLVKHFGRAVMTGQLGVALAHLMKINQIDRTHAMAYIDSVNEIWKMRSKFEWTQELINAAL